MDRQINKVIIHCSDSPDTMDIGLAEIEGWHRQRFSGISINGHMIYCGYHYIVRRNGIIEVGRPEQYIGAHAKGHNAHSIGVCWVGRDTPAQKQEIMLMGLVRNLMIRYNLSVASVIGHCEVQPAKTCPNMDMTEFRAQLAASMGMPIP